MQKKITFLIVLLSLFMLPMYGQHTPTIKCEELPQKTTPAMAINDFANIIDDNTQADLETKLRKYLDTTSIAIAIITVKNMNGYESGDYALSLFRCWGIGDIKTNRGILIFMALDEHRIEIATGYGIESLLTDYECTNIAKNDMVPFCKQGDYTGAIQIGLQKIIEKLGTIGWEERMAAIQAQKEKEAREAKVSSQNTLALLVILLCLGLLGFIVWLFIRWIKIIKLRKSVSRLISTTQTEIHGAEGLIKETTKSFSNDPTWAKNEAAEHIKLATKNLTTATEFLNQATDSCKKNPKQAQTLTLKAHELIEKSYASFQKANTDLRKKIQTVSEQAGIRLQEAQQQVTDNLKTINDFSKAGYNVSQFIDVHTNLSKILSGYQTNVNDTEFQHEVYTGSKVVQEQSAKSLSTLEGIVGQRIEVETQLEKLFAKAKEAGKKALTYLTTLDAYRKNYPPSVWDSIAIDLTKKSSKLGFANLTTAVETITNLNSMKVQDFATAYTRYQELQLLVESAESLCKLIDTTKTEQDFSKKNYPLNYTTAEKLVAEAINICRDSDVESTAKTLSKKAAQLLQEIAMESSHQLVDWIDITKSLSTCVSTAKDAISKAKRDISDAETAREHTRLAALAAEAARKESYVSSYNNDNRSSSSSSFGGFGGGSTGGGGGGASW